MKVPASLRMLYDSRKETVRRLRATVDRRILQIKEPRWHYESRIKELVSYALKVESGRVPDPAALEDHFACTIVVANATDIAVAEDRINRMFTVEERRPRRGDVTHKSPDSFPFDDLRLYVSIGDDPAEVRQDLVGIVFEVQIKTFLQHAWSIATHDLVYKTDDANWSKERIAYQIKAMLEHAEVSIQEADKLSSSVGVSKTESRTERIRQGIALVRQQWEPEELPRDLRRLACNIVDLLGALGIAVEELRRILDEGKADRGGQHPQNLSPYGIVVQYLLTAKRDEMLSLLEGTKGRARVLISREIELPRHIDGEKLKNAVFVVEGAP